MVDYKQQTFNFYTENSVIICMLKRTYKVLSVEDQMNIDKNNIVILDDDEINFLLENQHLTLLEIIKHPKCPPGFNNTILYKTYYLTNKE